MAIAFDAATPSANNLGISVTFSHTCTGSNLILIAAVSAAVNNSSQVVSTITYAGAGMTKIDSQLDTATNFRHTELWYLIAPATGANNVIVTYGVEPSDFFSVGVASYTGVKQSGQPDASGKNTSGASNVTAMSKSITTVADNCWIVGAASNLSNGTSNTADSGSFLRQSIYERVAGGRELWQLDSNGAKTPAGSFSQGWTWTTGAQANIVVASISPSADVTPPPSVPGAVKPTSLLMGLG